MTRFSDDPLDAALKWQSMGASRLHIVDLDGAATGEPVNLEIIKNIASAAMVPITTTAISAGTRMLRRSVWEKVSSAITIKNNSEDQ